MVKRMSKSIEITVKTIGLGTQSDSELRTYTTEEIAEDQKIDAGYIMQVFVDTMHDFLVDAGFIDEPDGEEK